MSKYDTPGMEGIGGMIRKDIEDAKKRAADDEARYDRRGGKHGDSAGTTIRKAAYNGANHFDNGLKKLVGL